MNPFKKFQHYFIGGALAKTDDVFEQVKAEVLFNFTVFFIFTNIPYLFIPTSTKIPFLIGVATTIALAMVLVILKKTSNLKLASYFFLLNFTLAIGGHYLINNGHLEPQGALFLVLFALCGYLLVDTKWGIILTVFVLLMFIVGVYNDITNFSIFRFPPEYADPVPEGPLIFITLIPVILNVYLVSQFVKAREKAEKQISKQKAELEVKQKEILDSIHYAKRIQNSLLPSDKSVDKIIERLTDNKN